MALELRVSVALVNTDPNPEEGEPRIVLRSRRSTSLIGSGEEGDGAVAGHLAIARHRLRAIVEEVAVDIDGQLEIAERNAGAG